MRELQELRDKMVDELREYNHKEMTAGNLEIVDKLAHAVKNLDKVIYGSEEGYSRRDGSSMYREGKYASRDSRGHYEPSRTSYDYYR